MMNIKPYKTVIIYLAAGIIWILVSDRLINYLFSGFQKEKLMYIYNIKGLIFICITTIILYYLTKKQQDTLTESNQQYRRLFESDPNPMWIYNMATYQFVEVNEATVEKYGYSRDEFLNMSVLEIRPPEDKKEVISFIEKVKNHEETSGKWTHQKKNGERFIVSIKSHPVIFNNMQCATVLAVDITERVTQRNKLEEAYAKEIELNEALASHIDLIKISNDENRRMAEILDKINNFVIIVGKEGLIKWVNKAFIKFTGYTLEEACNKTPTNLLYGLETDVQTIEEIKKSVSKEMHFSAELINYTKDRKPYWVEISFSPIYDEEGKLDGFISVENVINERKAREQHIHEQNNTLRKIAWVSSHEIRRPVSSIISLIVLLKTLEDGPQKKECLSLLEESSIELDNIVKDIAHKVNFTEGVKYLI